MSINTKGLGEADAMKLLADTEQRMGLPTTDPYRVGAEKLVDALDGI